MEYKLNLKHSLEPKALIALNVYASDKAKLEEIAAGLGTNVTVLMRSVINDILDGKIKVVL